MLWLIKEEFSMYGGITALMDESFEEIKYVISSMMSLILRDLLINEGPPSGRVCRRVIPEALLARIS